MIVLIVLSVCVVVILFPALITGDWCKDRCDKIERLDLV